jgi:predicted AlkP superfamily pyrophosphatase or phosphodiesterase
MQHGWGPEHYLSRAALTGVDYALGIIRKAVREAGIEDRTTFVIVADHGFRSVHHEVNIHPVLAASTLADRIRLHGSGWSVFVETTEEFDDERDHASLESFFDDLLFVDGVHRIVRPEDFHALGYPEYEENPYVRGQYIIIPHIDTYLVVDSSSDSTERRTRTSSHSHGYLPDHPRMRPALVLSGYRIHEGIRIGTVRNLDVATTIAMLLGLSMPDVEGHIINEAIIQ